MFSWEMKSQKTRETILSLQVRIGSESVTGLSPGNVIAVNEICGPVSMSNINYKKEFAAQSTPYSLSFSCDEQKTGRFCTVQRLTQMLRTGRFTDENIMSIDEVDVMTPE